MKLLIQKIDRVVTHDFSFTLLKSLEYHKWLNNDKIIIKYYNSTCDDNTFEFKTLHKNYTPIGSVEFVRAFAKQFYDVDIKPINVPVDLFCFSNRIIFNGVASDVETLSNGRWFVKSNDIIKSFIDILRIDSNHNWNIPKGNYQFSEEIEINSEWRAFVYNKTLVGLQNYSGDFTMFPNINRIEKMISAYKSAPNAYVLDVGVNNNNTFVIECHSMISVGLYGFCDYKVLPYMFNAAFKELIKN